MNRFLPLISCALVGILVASCTRNPQVAEPAYGSASGTAPRSAKQHHVALAQVPLRHPPRRAASEEQLLRPGNHLPAASETPAATNASTPPQDHSTAAPDPPASAAAGESSILCSSPPGASPKFFCNFKNATTPPHTDHLPTDPHVSTPPHTFEIVPPHYWRWQ
jgi:hypothetical protein